MSRDPQKQVALWRNRNFVLMWTSTAASGFGDRMIMSSALALLGAFGAGAGSASINSQTQFFFVLPYVFLSLFIGWLADKLPRKWMLLFCDEARAGLLLLAAMMIPLVDATAILPEDQQWKVYLLLTAIGCCAASFNPVRNAIVPDLMPRGQVQSANAVILTITVVASMIGVVIAPSIIDVEARASVRTALFLALVFYAVSGLFFAWLNPLPKATPAELEQDKPTSLALTGRYLLTHPRLIFLIAVHAGIWGVAAAVYSGIFAVSKINYGVLDQDLFRVSSYLGALLGLGLLVGAVVIGIIKTQKETTQVLSASTAAAGLCVLLLVWSPNPWLGGAAAFILGVTGNMAIITSLTLVQCLAPSYIRGRVMGVAAVSDNSIIVVVHFLIWQLGTRSDTLLIVAMQILGPAMAIFGLVWLGAHMRHGPMPNRAANAFWHFVRFWCYALHRLETVGQDRIPRQGAVILASNHLTSTDGFVIQAGCPRMVRWLLLQEYLLKPFTPFWNAIQPIALAKNSQDSEKVRQVIGELKKGELIGIFPEGTLQRDKRMLKPLQPGVAIMAKRSGAAIVPVWIHGSPRHPGLWINMFIPSVTTVVYGEPFVPKKSMKANEVMDELKRRMLALAHEVPEHRVRYSPVDASTDQTDYRSPSEAPAEG